MSRRDGIGAKQRAPNDYASKSTISVHLQPFPSSPQIPCRSPRWRRHSALLTGQMGMIRSAIRLFLGIVFTVIIAGCASATVRPISGPRASAVYGNISLSHGHIYKVLLYKVGVVYVQPFKNPPKSHVYTNGNFFFENLKPGKYFLVGFIAGHKAFYFNYLGLPKKVFLKKVAFRVKPGSVKYAGSYKVSGIDRHLFKTNTFEIKRSRRPSRNAILSQVAKAAAGTGWDLRFKQAIK